MARGNGLPDDCPRQVTEIARAAGRAVLAHYDAPECAVWEKEDASPLTAADQHADEIIRAALAALTPDIPVVTEECIRALGDAERAARFWLVDPLDGTREFIGRNGEFTVNIALIEAHEPVLGVVFAPALDRLFVGARGQGAFTEDSQGRRTIGCRAPLGTDAVRVLTSRSHGCEDEVLAKFLLAHPHHVIQQAGSSLKFCLIAAGEADLYPRLGRTMEWDTAAGDAVLRAAGGSVATLDGAPLRYGKAHFINPHFVARGLLA